MIEISIFKNANAICGFKCVGHSGFAKSGNDIVCAGVSTLTQNAVNSIEQLASIELYTKLDEKIGFLEVELPKKMTQNQELVSKIVLSSMVIGLKNLEEQYGKYLRLKEIQK